MWHRFLSPFLCFSLALILSGAPVFANSPTTIVRGDDDDSINIELGNYIIDGGGGIDTIVLPLFPNAYEFTETGENQFTAVYLDYTITIANVEYVEFGTNYQTKQPIAGLLSGEVQDHLVKLTDLYLAFFGRAPDVSGLEYWQEQLLEGRKDFTTISRNFAWSAEAQALYPKDGTNRDFVQTVYQNCFGRNPDAKGWDYWTEQLDTMGVTTLYDRGEFVGKLLLGAYAQTSGDKDRNRLANRHEVALSYVNRLSMQPEEGFDASINKLLILTTDDANTKDKAEQVLDHVFKELMSLTEVMNNRSLLDNLWMYGNATGVMPGEALTAFASEQDLERYIKNGLKVNNSNKNRYYYTGNVQMDMALAFSGQESATQATTYSTTNLQEAGVDEADIMKSDGNYLYLAPNPQRSNYYVTEFLLADVATTATDNTLETIRIMALDEQPAQAREVATIALENFKNQVDSLYLLTERESDYPDLLISIGGTQKNVWEIWDCSRCWQNTSTEVGLFDVSIPEAPQAAGHISLDGQLIASRRIGEYLYLVTRYTPVLQDYNAYPSTDLQRERNENIIEHATLADLLPSIRMDAGSALLVKPERTYLPPLNVDRLAEPTLITVTAIDLRNPVNRFSETIVGPAETVYVSAESLFVATTRHQYRLLVSELDELRVELSEVPPETTDIHKFRLTENGPEYQGSGTVVGNLGWEANKRPFRMGESQGVLRVATSLGKTWNETSTTRLTLLMENEDGQIEETAHLDNIGKAGERLYAVRYTGNRAYLVTFRVTDPLYVFDLSDPFSPRIEGELHIQGYSDYLHPISDSRLLGIGKDAIADGGATDFGGRGAWYQGVKLSLFDVSDLSSPEEISSVIIGKRGTNSDALIDHHAVTFLASSGNSGQLALPIQMHDTASPYDGFNPDSPSTFFDWTHTGLYMFNITNESIQSAGNLIVADRSLGDTDPHGSYGRDRSVIVNNSVHYIHANNVWSATWNDPQTMTMDQ